MTKLSAQFFVFDAEEELNLFVDRCKAVDYLVD